MMRSSCLVRLYGSRSHESESLNSSVAAIARSESSSFEWSRPRAMCATGLTCVGVNIQRKGHPEGSSPRPSEARPG